MSEVKIKARGSISLAEKCPELIKEWDYDKNGKLKPEHVTSGSGKKSIGNVLSVDMSGETLSITDLMAAVAQNVGKRNVSLLETKTSLKRCST